MAAGTPGYDSWNHSGSSPLRSPETTSPMYPDRPIKPLPKRRLRSRLSPEQAESIVFPPAPPSSAPVFHFPYSPAESRGGARVERRRGETDHHPCNCGNNHSEVESDDEDDERAPPLPPSPSYHYSRNGPGKPNGAPYHTPGSTSSSADGYESFENTNNKKKRKIPNMGSASTHHTNLSAEMASMGISHGSDGTLLDEAESSARYYASAPTTPQQQHQHQQHQQPMAAGTGMSGAGRGRFGRAASIRSDRRPLGLSASVGNAIGKAQQQVGASVTGTKRPPDQHAGIISAAIANAQHQKPPPGNENVSVVQHEAAKAFKPQQGPFTFTSGSDSANTMSWSTQPNAAYPQPPGAYPAQSAAPPPPPPPSHASRGMPPSAHPPPAASHGPQTSPHVNGGTHQQAGKNGAPPPARGAQANSQQQQQQQPPLPQPAPRKPRRSAAELYEIAARKRRIQQEYQNARNPPNPPWICEFCEYETIFGTPPMALIRQYEIKDRAERKRLAEKRRLLEKARMKGRKGKKASKKAQNHANNAQHPQNPAGGYDRHPDDASLEGPDDDFYDDNYDDLPPHHSGPCPPCDRQHCHGCHGHHHHKPPMPGPGDPLGGPRSVATGA